MKLQEGNQAVDANAKSTLKKSKVKVNISMGKVELRGKINVSIVTKAWSLWV